MLLSASFAPVLGGLQEVVFQLAREFTLLGHETLVVTNRYPRSLPASQVVDGITVKRMLFIGLPQGGWFPARMVKELAGSIISAINLIRLVIMMQRYRPDIVNIHFLGSQAMFGQAASRLVGIPYVISLHGDDVEGLPRRPKMTRKVFEIVIRHANHVTACSKYLLGIASDIVPEIRENGTTIWNGVDANEISSAEPHAHPRRYIFAAGRFVKKKGFDILLRAYRIALDNGINADLIMAGMGPEADALHALAMELGIQEMPPRVAGRVEHGVLFWGRASRKEMMSLLVGCTLLVVPSRAEPFGIIALEGLASGKPIVATRTGGLIELLSGRSRTKLVEPEDPFALSNAIVQLAEDGSGGAGRENVHVRTWRQVALDYLDVYRVCISGHD